MAESTDQLTWNWIARDIDATDRLAAAVASALPARATLALQGPLGAGKTRFVQGLAAALGVSRDEVVSPTFVLCHEYQGDRSIHHYDLYRLQRPEDFLQLGPEEAFEADGLVLIEWADRFPNCLPDDYLQITIHATSETAREFAFQVHGVRLQPVLVRLRAWARSAG